MSLTIYLHFDGNCREIFEFYRSIFGGDFAIFQTFADGPGDMGVAEDDMDKVMHVTYPIGSSVLMGSDVPSPFGPPPTQGNNFSISYAVVEQRRGRWTFRQVVGRRTGFDADERDVLGLVFRFVNRQVRYRLATRR